MFFLNDCLYLSLVSGVNLIGLKASSDGTLFWTDKYQTPFDETQYTTGQFKQSKATYSQGDTLALRYFDLHFDAEVKSKSWPLCQYRPFDL